MYRSAVVVRAQSDVVDELLAELARAATVDPPARAPVVIHGFLLAAALESALADLDDPDEALVAAAADSLADAVLTRDASPLAALRPALARLRSDRILRLSVPEGFAYYSLSPRRFAAHTANHVPREELVVVGVRTIGCALGAMTAAALRASRTQSRERLPWVSALGGPPPAVTRLSVRPEGPPYERTLALAGDRLAHVVAARDRGASFLVVDEGPGLSGSTFLAVAEALVAVGVPTWRIRMQGTRAVDPTALVTPHASERWRFGYASVAAFQDVREGERSGSGGAWRTILCASEDPPPLAWPGVERCKSIAPGVLRKYEGLGPYGEVVSRRAQALAGDGWCPRVLDRPDADGFVSYALVPGRPLRGLPSDGPARERVILHLARYLAARTRLTPPIGASATDEARLHEMITTNVALERRRSGLLIVRPRVERPVIPDGRMLPHEWIATPDGRLYKTDAAAHGDDHFFPGPTDIAWDVAGAIVEWDMHDADVARLIADYRAAAGDDVAPRLPAWIVAYAAFRARFSLFAAHGSPPADAAAWRRAHARYAARLGSSLHALERPRRDAAEAREGG